RDAARRHPLRPGRQPGALPRRRGGRQRRRPDDQLAPAGPGPVGAFAGAPVSGAARPRPPGGPVRFPALALVSLLILLLAGAGIALFSERAHRIETAREAGAQADLLASAVAGALAFDDP